MKTSILICIFSLLFAQGLAYAQNEGVDGFEGVPPMDPQDSGIDSKDVFVPQQNVPPLNADEDREYDNSMKSADPSQMDLSLPPEAEDALPRDFQGETNREAGAAGFDEPLSPE